jgi:hypothetical protein
VRTVQEDDVRHFPLGQQVSLTESQQGTLASQLLLVVAHLSEPSWHSHDADELQAPVKVWPCSALQKASHTESVQETSLEFITHLAK